MYQPNPKIERLRKQQEQGQKKLEQLRHREQQLQNRIRYMEGTERRQRSPAGILYSLSSPRES